MGTLRQSRHAVTRSSVSICVALLLLLTLFLPLFGFYQPKASAQGDVFTVRRFDTTQPYIALTFDAGSDRGFGAQILDTLKSKGVPASFGMTGVWAQQNPDLVQRMVREGHHLINHSWDHPDFTTITSAQRADQLKRTADIIRNQTGVELAPYFRPPFGAYNDAVLNDLAANGYTINVMWTVDTLGWNGLSASQITQRVLDGAAPGAIMLMHVGAASQDAAALPGMIDQLRARGFQFATVEDFISGNLSADARYFPETGYWLSHGFLRYWERYGGLAIFGYPISDEYTDPATGHVTQYFERARFEWQPGAWPERWDVLLGLLGREVTAGREGEVPFQRLNASSDANCTFYAQTGHRLCFGFRTYWERNGGLAIFGYPISEEFRENGYTVQYFERARFEWHPEYRGTQYEILLGRLGADLIE